MPPKKAKKEEEKKDDGEQIEWYKKIPKKYITESHNPGYEMHHLNLPFRILICGSSGSGKTQTLLSIMRAFTGTFEKITILTRMSTEPLYLWLNDEYSDKGIEVIEGTLSKLPDLNKIDKTMQTLLVLDDQITSSKKEMVPLCEYFIRARKMGVSLIFITQIFHEVPRMIRLQLSALFIKKLGSARDLTAIASQHSHGLSKEELKAYYERATEQKKDWLLIDCESFEPKYKIRMNWTPFTDLDLKPAAPAIGETKL